MIIDCHYHLETRMQSIENLIAKMDQNNIEKTALIATMCDPLPETPEFLLKVLRFFLTHRSFRGIARKLTSNFSGDGDLKLPKETVKIYSDPDNASVADALAQNPDRFLGWIFVNPNGKNDPLEEYKKFKDIPGFIGIKAHPFWHRYQPKALIPIAFEAQKANIPLLIHVGFNDLGDFGPLLQELPNLKLVLAHAGFPGYSDTWQQVKNNKNVYFDLSADAYMNAKTTKNVVDCVGVKRCLFGTDGPYGHHAEDGLFDNGFIKRRIETLFPSKKEQDKLMGDNFSSLVGA